MSKRQAIINELDTRLKQIKITNGYLTNAGDNVFAWRDSDLEILALPCIVYFDRLAGKRDDGAIGSFRWSLAIDIFCYGAVGKDTPALTRQLIADVLRAVGAADAGRWGGQAVATELADGTEMNVERRGKTAGEALVSINVIYDAPRWEV